MSLPRYILQAYLLTDVIALSAFGSPDAAGLAASYVADPDVAEPAVPSYLPIEDSARVPLVRREAQPHDISRKILADAAKQDLMRSDSDSEDDEDSSEDHEHVYQQDPRFTPEAIFSNKQIAPEIAEFLGHLAQRSRVHRKETNKAAREAGLIAEGRGRVSHPREEDDSDDIEDMKKSLKITPKTTPLAHLFEKMDTKSTAAAWNPSECAAFKQNVTSKYTQMSGKSRATWGTVGPAAVGRSEVHTGMFFHHWKLSKKNMKVAARKLRLSVLSFLATQDAAKVKLHIWTDLPQSNSTIRDILGPIAHHPEFMDAINITTFDPKVEFIKVPATLARETLQERFQKDTMPELRSDLYRSVILYNYGGLWMDADTVLMQDVAPLLGEDWAYLVKGREGAIEGALLSASHPQSHFSNAYLIGVVMRQEPIFPDIEKQKPLLTEIFSNDPAHTIMHVLPPCFMDSDSAPNVAESAVLSSDTSIGSEFFGRPVALPYREYFSIGIKDAVQDNSTTEVSVLQDSSFKQQDADNDDDEKAVPSSPVWAYHWRGNFAAPWARGSLADVAERTFMKKLQLQKHHMN